MSQGGLAFRFLLAGRGVSQANPLQAQLSAARLPAGCGGNAALQHAAVGDGELAELWPEVGDGVMG